MDRPDFYHRLIKHDWFYWFSDSFKAAANGESNEKILERDANNLGPDYVKMLEDFKKVRTQKIEGKKLEWPEPPENYHPEVFTNSELGW